MGRTFSAVPYTYLKRGVYYFVIATLGLQASLTLGGNWSVQKKSYDTESISEDTGIRYEIEPVTILQENSEKLFSFFPHSYSNLSEKNHLTISLFASEEILTQGESSIFGAIHVFDENDKYHTSITAKPFVLEWNNQSKGLQVSKKWQEVLPQMIFPRRFETFRLDGSERMDVFIADYGVDGRSPNHPNCGGQNRWFEIKNGKIHDKTEELPALNDLTHDLIVEDLNRDGLADLVVINDPVPQYSNKEQCDDPSIEEQSYILLSSKSGYQKYSFREIGITKKHLYLAGEASLNPSGSFDLLLSRDGSHSSGGIDIYNFEFEKSGLMLKNKTSFGLGNNNLGADIRKTDLNGNGGKDFVISNSASTDWNGHNLYVASVDNGDWTLSKLFYERDLHGNLGKQDKGWCERVFLVDLDDNSSVDYVCANRTKPKNLNRPPVIIRKGQDYYPLKFVDAQLRQFVPFKTVDRRMLVGTRYGKATETDVMLEWQFHGYEVRSDF